MIDTRFSVSIQIMVTLAYHPGELMNSETLAMVLKTNPTFVRKLVSRLVDHQLVESFRGKGGGIRISKPAEQISLKEIYVAASNDKTLVSAHKKPTMKACPVSCSIDTIFCEIVQGIETTTQSFLSKRLLSDLVKKVAVTRRPR